MNQQHLDMDNQEPLRSQRMTEDEARAVIDLWQQEQTDSGGLTTSPAVPDMAEGLNVTVEDVQRLLAQVRARREEEEQQLAQDQWQLELEQIRLAEEERKLAEVQRQRAELRRQQAEREGRQAEWARMTPSAFRTRQPRPVIASFQISPPTPKKQRKSRSEKQNCVPKTSSSAGMSWR